MVKATYHFLALRPIFCKAFFFIKPQKYALSCWVSNHTINKTSIGRAFIFAIKINAEIGRALILVIRKWSYQTSHKFLNLQIVRVWSRGKEDFVNQCQQNHSNAAYQFQAQRNVFQQTIRPIVKNTQSVILCMESHFESM